MKKWGFVFGFGVVAASLALLGTGCVSAKKHRLLLDGAYKLGYAKASVDCLGSKRDLQSRVDDMDAVRKAKNAEYDNLRARVDKFLKYPHTCKHKHLLY